ncbi:MAG: dihydroorotate dehydrogenase electron transfer subunit [Rectinema sp.]|nr:dihydroorotate dehydrogenase electron transfer subunit [Rectinema sp.]
MRQFNAVISINDPVAPDWRHLAFEWPCYRGDCSHESPKPGQFFTLLPSFVETGAGAILRRPLAFAGITTHGAITQAHALYEIRGPMTRALSRMEPGMPLGVIGPLGTSFPLPQRGFHAIIAGGGIGTGPVLYLAERLEREGFETTLILGFRSKSHIPFAPPHEAKGLPEWRTLIQKAIISTDDGSFGIRGTVADAFTSLQKSSSLTRSHLYACGPAPMLAALGRIADKAEIPAHFSAEQWMACGVGACHGCVIRTKSGSYVRVCTEGPVFDAHLIDWEAIP